MADSQQPSPNVVAAPAVDPVVVVTPVVPVEPAAPIVPVEHVLTEIEQRAVDQGWKPLDQWTGDPSDHRSAKEYIDRGELLGKIKSQSVEMREIKQMLTTLSKHNKDVFQAGYERALTELKAAKVVALRDGDAEAVVDLDERIMDHKQAIATIKNAPVPRAAAAAGPEQEQFESWLQENRWYERDEGMRYWADGMALAYGKKNLNPTPEGVFNYLSKQVKVVFPDKFPRVGAISPDGDGRKSSGPKGVKTADKFEQLLAEMPEHQANAARNLVKSGVLTKEKYVEDFDAIGGR